MNILVSVNAAWNVWNFRRPVVAALLRDGHRVTVLAPPDSAVPDLEAMGCAFFPLDMSVKSLNPLEDFRLVRRFKRIFAQLRPDVILSYTIKNNIFGALAARDLGIPFVPNVSGLGTAFLSGSLVERVAVGLYKRAFRTLPVVFFQNPDDRDLFLARGLVQRKQAHLLPGSGIDLDRFALAPYRDSEGATTFLMIARLLRDKGVLEYVEAARAVRAKYPHARFQILGAADSENRTAIDLQTVISWEVEGAIEYLGTTHDVRGMIDAAHCVVLPSYREGAPRTLIEAAAMGRPLIATDVPGCRSVVEDGQTGFLCEVRSAASLADACKRLLALSHEMRRDMGKAGRRKMEQEYDQALVVEAYKNAIASVTSQAPHAA